MCRLFMTTHRLDKNVSGKCSAMPHMSQGCQRSRSDSPQLVNSMRRRQWRRTNKHTFPVYVMDWWPDLQDNKSCTFCIIYISIKWDIQSQILDEKTKKYRCEIGPPFCKINCNKKSIRVFFRQKIGIWFYHKQKIGPIFCRNKMSDRLLVVENSYTINRTDFLYKNGLRTIPSALWCSAPKHVLTRAKSKELDSDFVETQ